MARIVNIARFTADGAQVTREFQKMGEAGEKMADRVKKGAGSMTPALRAVDAAAGEARGAVDGLANRAGPAGTVLRAMGPAGLVAAAGIGVATAAFVALQAATRDAVRDLGAIKVAADRVGVSTDTLQELRFAILGIGGAAEQADAAVSQFAEKIGEATLTRSGGAYNALTAIGFGPDEIAGMRSIEEALPRITERISQMTDATEQMRVARELGLEPLLPLLQQGEGAFAAAAAAARDMGYVLDRELLERAAEFNGQWEQASRIIDVQFKSALVNLAPIFIDLANTIASTTTRLVEFLRQLDLIQDHSNDGLTQRIIEARAERDRLIARFGDGVQRGGDANRGNSFGGGNYGVGATLWNRDAAADRVAYLTEQIGTLGQRLRASSRAELPAISLPRTLGATGASATPSNADLARHEQFVAQLREEIATRERLAGLAELFPKAIDAERQAQFDLHQQLMALNEARAAGAIATDEELKRLQQTAIGHHTAAEAVREHAAAQARWAQQASQRDRFLAPLVSPREQIEREISLALKDTSVTAEEAAARVAQLRGELRELAAAQYEASLQGQILNGVLQGQVRDLNDVAAILRDIAADALIRELLAGGVMGEGGFGGFASRVGDRIAGGVTGNPDASWRDMFGPVEESVTKAATALGEEFTGSVGKAAAEAVVGAAAGAKQNVAMVQTSLSLTVLTKQAQAASVALARIAAQGGGGKDFVSALASALGGGLSFGGGFFGGASSAADGFGAAFGGGRAGGGPMYRDKRHPVSEFGPEVLLTGGWGQVFPHAAVEGLELISRLAKAAPAAAAQGNGGGLARISVNVINQLSGEVDVAAEQRVNADGEAVLDVTLRRKTESQIARGDFDGAFGGRYQGLRRNRIPR